MEVATEVLYFFINFFSLYLDFRTIRLFTETNKRRTKLFHILFAVFCFVNWFSFQLIPIPYVATVITFLCLLLITVLCFYGTIFIKVVSVLSALSLGAISEEIIWHFLNQNNTVTYQNASLGNVLSSILFMMIVVLIESFVKINKSIPIPKGYYLSFLALFVSSIILGEVIVLMNPSKQFLATLGLGTICFMNIAILFLYGKIIDAYQKILEKEALKQNLTMHQNQMELMTQSIDHVRSLQHDLKHHLILLDNYIRENNAREALDYIQEISTHLSAESEYACTGNYEIDCVLNYYLQIAEQIQCDIALKVSVPKSNFMSAFDLNTLLSNLLKNAIEALEHSSQKNLNVYIRYDKAILFISIYNSYEGELKTKGKFFQTTKHDFEHHGYGLQNVNKIVEKYNGDSTFTTEDNCFRAEILLYTKDIRDAQS